MKLLLSKWYAGKKTQERNIAPGTYDVNDPRLFGIGQYLLDNGHATPVYEVDSAGNGIPSSTDFERAVQDYLAKRGLVAIPQAQVVDVSYSNAALLAEVQSVAELLNEEAPADEETPADEEPAKKTARKPK